LNEERKQKEILEIGFNDSKELRGGEESSGTFSYTKHRKCQSEQKKRSLKILASDVTKF